MSTSLLKYRKIELHVIALLASCLESVARRRQRTEEKPRLEEPAKELNAMEMEKEKQERLGRAIAPTAVQTSTRTRRARPVRHQR